MAVALYKITTAQPNQIVYGNKMEIKYMAAGMTDPATGDFTSIELDVFFGDLTTESVPFARVPVTQEGVDFPPDWVACYDGDILRPTILATTITDSISELMTQP
jgi:hypothetical protein